ncbi:MAG: OmpA family protein [Bacteroidales bacterium]|nr:OmpA family protein [Bacteroidales bacterium]
MKKIFYSVIAVAAMLVSANLNAQQPNKDLLIGPGSSNWFMEIGGGLNFVYDEGKLGKYSPAVEINLGKWFTPAIGFRAGYHGISNLAADKPETWISGKERMNFHMAHVDAMWNIANTATFKASRVWNPILYVRGGLILPKTKAAGESTIGIGAGLANQFRLGNHVSLSIDISNVTAAEKPFRVKGNGAQWVSFPTVTGGLVFDLGSRGFNRPVVPVVDTRALDEARAQLRAANERAEEAVRSAAAANAVVRNLRDGKTYLYKNGGLTETVVKEAEKIEKDMIVPEILYFDLGKATLTGRELARLEYYAENTFKKDQKLLVTGCADLGTGTREANDRLSKQRAEYVKSVLVNQFGYRAENIETKADVMPGDAPIKGRIVTIEVQ